MEVTSKNIVLVGPMGSGKTTIGRRLAHELNQDFFDTCLLYTSDAADE